jgi:hypothetical protein
VVEWAQQDSGWYRLVVARRKKVRSHAESALAAGGGSISMGKGRGRNFKGPDVEMRNAGAREQAIGHAPAIEEVSIARCAFCRIIKLFEIAIK